MELKEDARAWLVNSWHIVFRRRPSMGEEFLVKTWPYKFKGVFGMRNFLMESMDGEALVYADSQWFYFDQGTGRPIKAKPEDVEPFGMGEPYPMEYTSRKLTYPEELEYRGTVRVCENHLDTNAHMNNGEYIRIAANFLPSGFSVGDLQVEYRLAAKLGDPGQYEADRRRILCSHDRHGRLAVCDHAVSRHVANSGQTEWRK